MTQIRICSELDFRKLNSASVHTHSVEWKCWFQPVASLRAVQRHGNVLPKHYHCKYTVSMIFLFSLGNKDIEALPVSSRISF